MERIEKTVFLSYRRTNFPWALAIFQDLRHHGYDVFFDYSGIASGDFEQVIIGNIKARAHFLVLLTPSALERCGDPRDWLRREIETALATRRNVVPLMFEGFDFDKPRIAGALTGRLALLKNYSGMNVSEEYFGAAMRKLRERYLNVTLDAVLHPASPSAQQAAKDEQVAAGAAPAVTDKELAEQESFERALDYFTHEFRTPLTAIKASVITLLSATGLDPDSKRELLTVIDEESDRLNRLFGDMVEMAQFDAQGVELRREIYPVRAVVEAALEKFRPWLTGREVKVQIPDSLSPVRIDLERMAEVLVQLLENAAKYSPAGTPITISAEAAGKVICLSVGDRGPGIDDVEQSRIFEKFYRGRDQRYRVQGTGMGLPIAKAIVEAHGGTLGVTSQLGSGSAFHFTIPV